jgi:hypothetical protein
MNYKLLGQIQICLFVFIALSLIISCSPSPNTRWFIKDNIKFWADLNISAEGNHYHILEVGTPEHPYNGIPALYIMLPDNKVISLKDTDANKIKNIGDRTTIAKGEHPVDWPKGSENIYSGAYNFVVHENKILSFSARHLGSDFWKKNPAIIGKSPEGSFFRFPLSETDVKQLIGEPDKIRDFYIK